MKNIFLISIFFVAVQLTQAQECLLFPMTTGMEWEFFTFNDKDKQTGTIHYKILEVKPEDGMLAADVQVDMKNEKGKPISSSTVKYKCDGSNFYVDMSGFMNAAQNPSMQDWEARGEISYLEIPSHFTVGESLPDGLMKMDFYSSGTQMGIMDIAITERKVIGQESVTVPAGTFDCYKISSTNTTKFAVMGIGVPFTVKSIEYIAPGSLFVKSESFDKNDKPMGYTVLSMMKK